MARGIEVDYDRENDVLYVSFGRPVPAVSEPDRTLPNLLWRRSLDSGEIVGLTVYGYSTANKEALAGRIPFAAELPPV